MWARWAISLSWMNTTDPTMRARLAKKTTVFISMSTFYPHCININYCRRLIRWATSVSWMNTTDSALGARPAKLSSRRSVFIQASYHLCLITTSKHLKDCEERSSSKCILSTTSSYLLFTHFHHSWHWIPHIVLFAVKARIMISISGIVHIFTSGAVVTLIKEVFFCNYPNLFYSPPSLIFIKVGAKKNRQRVHPSLYLPALIYIWTFILLFSGNGGGCIYCNYPNLRPVQPQI